MGITVGANGWIPYQAWIGLHDPYGNGDLKWTDGTAIDYLNWGPSWPNQPGSPIGVALTTDEVSGYPGYYQHWFDDFVIHQYRAFICKKSVRTI